MPVIDSNTLILCKCDIWDLVDSSPIGHSVTDSFNWDPAFNYNTGSGDPWNDWVSAEGNPDCVKSLKLNNGTQYGRIEDNSGDFDLGTGDFTVDYWFHALDGDINASASANYIMGSQDNDTNFDINVYSAAGDDKCLIHMIRVMGANRQCYVGAEVYSGANNYWQHIAFVRKSGQLMCFANGILTVGGEGPITTNQSIANVGGIYIGRSKNTTSRADSYAIKYFRLSNVARWWSGDANARGIDNFNPWEDCRYYVTPGWKVSGEVLETVTINVYQHGTNRLMASEEVSPGSYEITDLDYQTVDVYAVKSNGETLCFGNVTAISQ